MKTGIYIIINLVNYKAYVGYACNIYSRTSNHRKRLQRRIHDNIHLQKAWNKYGEESFKFGIIELCNREQLCAREHYWAMLLRVHDRKIGYNIKPTNPNGLAGQSQETIEKLRKAHKGKKLTEEHKLKIGSSNKGKSRHYKRSPTHKKVSKPVICIQTGEIFSSSREACMKYNINNRVFSEYIIKNKIMKKRNLKFEFI